jgi:hypothetical protein
LLAAGLCFYCEEPGHIVWECPAWQEDHEENDFYDQEDPDYEYDEGEYEEDW